MKRIWQTRGPISLGNGGLPGRGGGRGGSVDRGRGRARGIYHSNLGYQRSTSLYDDDLRGGVGSRVRIHCSISLRSIKGF